MRGWGLNKDEGSWSNNLQGRGSSSARSSKRSIPITMNGGQGGLEDRRGRGAPTSTQGEQGGLS